MMMMWWGGGWWWLAGVVFVVICMVMMGRMMTHRHSGRGGSHGHERSGAGAQEILAERFARGEISEDEFEQRKRALERRMPVDAGVHPGMPGAP